jgi:hypothetical protein
MMLFGCYTSLIFRNLKEVSEQGVPESSLSGHTAKKIKIQQGLKTAASCFCAYGNALGNN